MLAGCNSGLFMGSEVEAAAVDFPGETQELEESEESKVWYV